MSPLWAAALIAAAGVLVSVVTSVFISGAAWGKVKANVDYLMTTRTDLASKEQVTAIALQVSEIKGMFRVTLKTEHGGGE